MVKKRSIPAVDYTGLLSAEQEIYSDISKSLEKVMKQLFIIRHAEAALTAGGCRDLDRELTEQGEEEAHYEGNWFEQNYVCPDLMVVSCAKRTLHTANLIAGHCHYNEDKLLVKPEIYNADLDTLLDIIHNLDDQYQTVFLIGHNPGVTELANHLSDEAVLPLSPCTVVQLSLSLEHWHDVKANNAHLITVSFPGD